jgi:hypothetical protein
LPLLLLFIHLRVVMLVTLAQWTITHFFGLLHLVRRTYIPIFLSNLRLLQIFVAQVEPTKDIWFISPHRFVVNVHDWR